MFDLRHLPNAAPDEKLVYFLRRHPVTNLDIFFGTILLLLAPFAIFWYLNQFQPDLLMDQAIFTLILLGGSIFFLFVWLFLFQSFIDYYLDIWIVTNRRILNIEQKALFSRTVSELHLHRIQDVTAEVNGFIHTMFDYGNVEIATAAEKERFVFEDVPHPNQVAKAVLDLAYLDRKQHLEEAVENFGIPEKKEDG